VNILSKKSLEKFEELEKAGKQHNHSRQNHVFAELKGALVFFPSF
jgi:hypothetical protein